MLGFAELSKTARRLEAASETGEAFESTFRALMVARSNAISALGGYVTTEQIAT